MTRSLPAPIGKWVGVALGKGSCHRVRSIDNIIIALEMWHWVKGCHEDIVGCG